jgi:2-dehydro-3-deoxyphosphogluconate aldolase/(4S)-4-hydroxy-2-oxoglutarate aldolase
MTMTRREALVDEIGKRRVSAIIRTRDRETARRAMQAAVAGGFRLVEFTSNTPGALELIAEFAADERLLVGAGTVLTPRQAADAVEAGARFLVSPVVDGEVIAAAGALDVPAIPGAQTPTEMMTAHRAGAEIIKIFPAPADLPVFVAQVLGPLRELKLFPTAGVTPANFLAVLEAGAFGVGFVTSLFDPADLAAGRFVAVEARARDIHKQLARQGGTGAA